MDGNERKINTFYAGQIRYRSIIEVSSDHGIGGSSFIGVFRRNRGEHAFIYFRLGSRDLLLFSDIFKCRRPVGRSPVRMIFFIVVPSTHQPLVTV